MSDACVYMCICVNVCVCACGYCICEFICVTSYTHIGLSSLVFGQAGLTIDCNWTSQARGVCSCTCTLFCECVCVCVCGICLEYVCVYFGFYNISACYQVGLNSPSIIKLDLSSKGS